MKPFNLEAAKRGEPMITTTGLIAKFVAHIPEAQPDDRVVVLVDGQVWTCGEDGQTSAPPHPMFVVSGWDLRMATKKYVRYGWVDTGLGGVAQKISPTWGFTLDEVNKRQQDGHIFPLVRVEWEE